MTVHLGIFGTEKVGRRFQVYLEDENEGAFFICLRPGWEGEETILFEWCEENIGAQDQDWSYSPDEFYSPITSGHMFEFHTYENVVLFRMAWCF